MGEEAKISQGWPVKLLVKIGARVSHHAERWQVHVASAFPLALYYLPVFSLGAPVDPLIDCWCKVRYTQRDVRTGFLGNLIMSLPAWDLLGHHIVTFSGSGKPTGALHQRRLSRRDRPEILNHVPQ